MSETLKLTEALIAKFSVTPHDAGCQQIIEDRLKKIGFKVEHFQFGDVSNIWATLGNTGPVLCFAGHTDVVPAGDLTRWESPPFHPTHRDGYLYGRGAVDMKSSIASMVVAVEQFVKNNHFPGTLAFLITSDEEGPSIQGTKAVLEVLKARQQSIDYCIVGEPSSSETLGDTIKHGRRGSIHGELKIYGKQGHVAYPDKVKNPIHSALKPLSALATHKWDQGNEDFPATSLQITNIKSGIAKNVVPEVIVVDFNLRFSNCLSVEDIKQTTDQILKPFDINYELHWDISGLPFLTQAGELLEAIQSAIAKVVNIQPTLSTAGGTSDGRFFAPYGSQVVEFGHCNRTLHEVNECIEISSLDKLTEIYYQTLLNLS